MASLESKIRSKFKDDLHPNTVFAGNLKLYYNQYPYSITLISPHDARYGLDSEQAHQVHRYRSSFYALKRLMKRKLSSVRHSTRIEFNSMRIYTVDPMELLDFVVKSKILVEDEISISKAIYRIELMDDACLGKLRQPVTDSIKTTNVVAKRLPWGKYRYRIHWACMGRDKRNIGMENLIAITDQLKNFDQLRISSSALHEISGRNYYTSWSATYFYAEDLDWLPIVCLIDGRFIKKIERFQTEEELKEEFEDARID